MRAVLVVGGAGFVGGGAVIEEVRVHESGILVPPEPRHRDLVVPALGIV